VRVVNAEYLVVAGKKLRMLTQRSLQVSHAPFKELCGLVGQARRYRIAIRFTRHQWLGRFAGFRLHCARCSRSSRAPSFFRQNGHGRNTGGRPPDLPATLLCAALIH
jgi:hypothetical protein